MKTFKIQAAQGDLLIRRIDSVPEDATATKSNGEGNYVVAHSETGHHHVIKDGPGVTLLERKDDPFMAWLQVVDDPIAVEHLRSFDTHETIEIPPGNYEIRRQREYTPEGYRRAQD